MFRERKLSSEQALQRLKNTKTYLEQRLRETKSDDSFGMSILDFREEYYEFRLWLANRTIRKHEKQQRQYA